MFLNDFYTRANNFYCSKERSLNIKNHNMREDYINILKTHTLCILDTETTGLSSSDKIWQISIRVISNYEQIDELNEYFKPANYNELYDKRKFKSFQDVMPLTKINEFLQKYHNSVIVAHNISFDVPRCEKEGIVFPEDDYFFDTIMIIKHKMPRLSKFCIFNKVSIVGSKCHDAHYDTRLLRDCVVYWLQNYMDEIRFSNGEKNLYKLVKKITNPNDKITRNDIMPFEDSISKLKELNYTIIHNKVPIYTTDSYYKVVVNKSTCYITYNYIDEDISDSDSSEYQSENITSEITISDEQKEIVKAISESDVTVDAVAGSGKTTTAMFIAKEYPDKNILLITYNKQLQLDNKSKCSCLKNIDVYTFHGYCGRIYRHTCNTDSGIYKCLLSPTVPKQKHYDIVIVDEAQDLKDCYYKFIKKILQPYSRLMLVGDKYQNIYRFNGANSDYLEHPEKYFDNRTFKHLTLQMSYRLTNQMSMWLNNNVMHQERIKTCKDGEPVTLIFDNDNFHSSETAGNFFGHYIVNLINSGVDINQIMILSPSLRGPAINKCVYTIKTNSRIPIYIPKDDDEPVNRDLIKNKVLFSSIHQSKGIERDYVFLFKFDTGYCYTFNDYLYELNNLFYVGLTRAKKKLTCFIRDIVVKDKIYEPFSFIDYTKHKYVEYINFPEHIDFMLTQDQIKPVAERNVTSLCKFISSENIEKIKDIITVETLPSQRITLNIPSYIDINGNIEEVSDITALALTSLIGSDDPYVIKYIEKLYRKYNEFINHKFKEDHVSVPDEINDISDMLRLMTYHEYADDDLVHRPLQMNGSKFDWISQEQFELIQNVTVRNINQLGNFEVPIVSKLEKAGDKSVFNNIVINNNYSIETIRGRIDFIGDDIIEFKFVNDLQYSHYCQTILYAIMKNRNTGNLYNIKTGEYLKLTCNDPATFLELILEKEKC